jgi:DNA invertase Pin-like site-specific DNA recombinase
VKTATNTENTGQPLVISYLRFSSPEQAKGDSVRRQIEASERWAEAKGWKIDDRLRDEGLSAFHGVNKSIGALGRILTQIDNGTVPAGSYLIIENLDRISRTELLEAISLLINLITKGITVVTLDDGREYNKANYDFTQLVLSASSMLRANEESKKKSERVGAAWRQKKHTDAANGIPITRMLPPWLQMNGNKIKPIPARVNILKEVFNLSLKGRGALWIAKHLNARDGAEFSGKPWNDTYIMRTLRNPGRDRSLSAPQA